MRIQVALIVVASLLPASVSAGLFPDEKLEAAVKAELKKEKRMKS